MDRNLQIKPDKYYKKYKIENYWNIDKSALDETRSYLTVKKGKKNVQIRFMLGSLPSGLRGSPFQFFWNGWRSRLERIQTMVDKAQASANKYYDEVMLPLFKANLGRFHYWEPGSENRNLGRIDYLLIERQRTPLYPDQVITQDSLSWSDHCSTHHKSVPRAALCQVPNWWQADKLRKVKRQHDDKWARYHTAKRYLFSFLEEKLELIAKNFKTDEVIEFQINNHKYRFVKQMDWSSRDSDRFGRWKMISAREPKIMEPNSILSKELYL